MSLENLYQLPVYWISLAIFFVLFASCILGIMVGQARQQKGGDDNSGNESLVAALLGIMGLVLAFTYSYNLSRLDTRKAAVVQEANAAGTAFLRADLLPTSERQELQTLIRDYTASRIFRNIDMNSPESVREALDETLELQSRLWPLAFSLSEGRLQPPERTFLLGAINDLIDAHTVRLAAARDRMPPAVFYFTLAVAVAALFVSGNNAGIEDQRPILRLAVYSFVLAIVNALILDFDQTSNGFIRLSSGPLVAALADMNAILAQ